MTVATVKTYQPEADIKSYAVRMFQNYGKGIGDKGKDNGVLIVLALDDREVWIETGYGLEGFITDGFAGETSRSMVPFFRSGDYGRGLVAGATRVAQRIAEGRNVNLGSRAAAARRETQRRRQRRVSAGTVDHPADHLPEPVRRRPPAGGVTGGPAASVRSVAGLAAVALEAAASAAAALAVSVAADPAAAVAVQAGNDLT